MMVIAMESLTSSKCVSAEIYSQSIHQNGPTQTMTELATIQTQLHLGILMIIKITKTAREILPTTVQIRSKIRSPNRLIQRRIVWY